MSKRLIPAVLATLLLAGCASVPRGSIPVVDAGSSIGRPAPAQGGYGAPAAQAQSLPEDSGVVVMVPGATGSSAPIQSFPAPGAASEPWSPGTGATDSYGSVPAPVAPSGIPGSLAQDEQLDGPVLALLTTAQQQQGGGDLNGAAASLERAQRIAPREPQVLYRLAEVRLAQGDAAQAEQFARRGLSYAAGRPALQASLWNLIAQARERQGDAAGAAQAREQARVSL